MKKLSKTQIADRDQHSSALFDAHTALEAAITKYNETIEAAKAPVETAIAEYNQKVTEATDFCQEIVSEMESYEGERSEKWLESDAAASFQDWKSEWENVALDEADIDFPDPLDVPENPQEVIDALPTEASS